MAQVFAIFKRLIFIKQYFKKNQFDLIIFRSHVIDGLLGYILAKQYRIPFVFVLRNPLEQEWESYKIDCKRPIIFYYVIAKVKRIIVEWLLKHSNLIIPISKYLEERLLKQDVGTGRFFSLPEAVDVHRFSGQKNMQLVRENFCISSNELFIYVGSLGKSRHLDVLIKAFAILLQKNSKAKLLFVGEGNDKENLVALVKKLGINKSIFFMGQISHNDVPLCIAASDFGICTVPPYDFYKLSSPIKLFEYMAMGKPVLVNFEIPEQKDVVEQSGGGVAVPFNIVGLSSGMEKLIENNDRAKAMGLSGRNWILKNRTFEIMAKKLEERLTLLLYHEWTQKNDCEKRKRIICT
jgi:glycosyltransferase involved in cell wall biosynthesis